MRKSKKKSLSYKVFLWFLGMMLILIAGIVIYIGKVYIDVRTASNKSFVSVERITKSRRKQSVNYEKGSPFSLLLLGVDTGDLGRKYKGRSDSMVVVTVNPSKQTTTLVSIPRDTYTTIVGKNTKDKINHAYAFGGIPMAIATVENLLDIPIDHYAEINMEGMKDLVKAIGEVEVNNTLTFSYEGSEFSIGKQTLDGEQVMKYTRMRYDDPKGDYGRQARQRQVLAGIIKKLKSVDTITNYSNLLNILGKNAATDVTWDTLKKLLVNYREALTIVHSDQLAGESFTGDGRTGESGISYQRASNSELTRVKKELSEQLKE